MMGDEKVISYASAGQALCGFSVTSDGDKTSQLLAIPKDCKLMGPSHPIREFWLSLSNMKECEDYFKKVKESGFSFEVNFNNSGELIPISLGGGYDSSSLQSNVESTNGFVYETCELQCAYVPTRSFRIGRQQMHLSHEALEDALRVDDHVGAKRFLERYNSHIFDDICHVGGAFFKGIIVKATKSTKKIVLSNIARKKLHLDVGSRFIATETAALKSNKALHINLSFAEDDYTSEMISYIIGPNAETYETFKKLIHTNENSWHIIHRSKEGMAVPVWNIMIESKNDDLKKPAKLIREEWQSSVAKLAQQDEKVKKLLRDSYADNCYLNIGKEDDVKEKFLASLSKFSFRDIHKCPTSKAVDMLKEVWSHTGMMMKDMPDYDLRVILFNVPAFADLVNHIAKSTEELGKEFLQDILQNGELLRQRSNLHLSPAVEDLLKDVSSLSLQEPEVAPKDLSQHLKDLMQKDEFHISVIKAIRDCINNSKVKEIVKRYGFHDDGNYPITLTSDQVKYMIEELEICTDTTTSKKVSSKKVSPIESPKFIIPTTPEISQPSKGLNYSYIGDIVVDRSLRSNEEAGQRLIDCLRHRMNPFPKSNQDEDVDDDEDDWPSDAKNQQEEKSSKTPLQILVQIMEKSSFLAQIAVCKLLLEQRYAVPLVFTCRGEENNSSLRQIVEALDFFEVSLGKQGKLSLVENIRLPRVIFVSDKEVCQSESAAIASEITNCNFVSQYEAGTLSVDETVVEIGVGFVQDSKMYLRPFVSVHIFGNYSKLTHFITSFANLIIVETEKDTGLSKESYQWECQTGIGRKHQQKVWGNSQYIKKTLTALILKKVREFDPEIVLNQSLRNIFHENILPVHHYNNITKDIPYPLSRDMLLLQKSYELEAELYFQTFKLTSDQAEQRVVLRKCQEEQNYRVKEASKIYSLGIIQHFIGLLKIPDMVERAINILQFQASIKSKNDEMLEKAAYKRDKLLEKFQENPSSDNKNLYRKAQEEYVQNVFSLEHLWRELSHIFVSDPVEYGYLAKLAAVHLMDGFPLEILDGDAAMFCSDWVSRIFIELDNFLKHPRIFFLSVMGLQSSGKSTLLNLMFGTQLRTSTGQCTRGIYIQLVKSNRKEYDYVLLLDTEGIRSPEHFGLENSEVRDNRLATFAVLPADASIMMVSNEDDNGLKEVLPMVMLAFKRSSIREKLGGQMRSKLFFVYRSIDVNETEKLRNSQQKLHECLQNAAEQVSKSSDEDRTKITSYVDFRIHKDEGRSDVKYLGNLKRSNSPPHDTPDWDYGEKVVEVREYIHKRVITEETHWRPQGLVEWSDYLRNVWNCICSFDFELSFKSVVEYWSHLELQGNISECRQKVGKIWMEEFDDLMLNKQSKDPSVDSCFEELEEKVKDALEEPKKKMLVLLGNSRWKKWKLEETRNWDSFLAQTKQQWHRKVRDWIDGEVKFQNDFNTYMRHIKIESANLVIGKNYKHNEENVKKDFAQLFTKVLYDAETKYKPLNKDVPMLVHSVYDTIVLDCDINSAKDIHMPTKYKATEWIAKKTGHKKDLKVAELHSNIISHLQHVKQYSSTTVEEVIGFTERHIESLDKKHSVITKDEKAQLHKFVRKEVIKNLIEKQEIWDSEHNCAGKLKAQEKNLFLFFQNRVKELKGTELLLSELKNIFDNELLRCFSIHLVKTLAVSLQGEQWVLDSRVWRAKLDMYLLEKRKEKKIDDMLNCMADDQQLCNTVFENELNKRWFNLKEQKKSWENFKSSFNRSMELAIQFPGNNIGEFLQGLKNRIGEQTKSVELVNLIDSVNPEVYENYTRDLDYHHVAKELGKYLKDSFREQKLDGELMEMLKERMQQCQNESARPRCDISCPQCGITCYHPAGHRGDHDTVHQPQGLKGVRWDPKCDRASELCEISCAKAVSNQTNLHLADGSYRPYAEFDQIYEGWTVPHGHRVNSFKIREYAFAHYQSNLVKLYPGSKECSRIPPEYHHHDIKDIKKRLKSVISNTEIGVQIRSETERNGR